MQGIFGTIRQRMAALEPMARVWGWFEQSKTFELSGRTLELAPGDQIRFSESNRHIGAYKGEIGRIMAIDGDVLTVSSQSGSDIKVDTREFKGIDYGYTLFRSDFKS
jgi:ATP-dependent exoDNAse (exonuclease V) alpha subunit